MQLSTANYHPQPPTDYQLFSWPIDPHYMTLAQTACKTLLPTVRQLFVAMDMSLMCHCLTMDAYKTLYPLLLHIRSLLWTYVYRAAN
jgi:hypothetical protein